MRTTDPAVTIRPLTDDDRRVIAQWRYPAELSIYDPGSGALALREPDHVALAHADVLLLGYGTLGIEAQVPGGNYDERSGAPVTDLGIGLAPDLLGRRYGAAALGALLVEATRRTPGTRARATVATSNARASALVVRAGFEATHTFVRAFDGRAFTQFERDATSKVD